MFPFLFILSVFFQDFDGNVDGTNAYVATATTTAHAATIHAGK